VIGLDLANIDAVVPTLESSRDSGTLVASPRMTGFSSFDGIYIALPIYDTGTPVDSVQARQASFVGALGAFVNVANLIARSLDAHELRGGRTDVVSLIIRDLSAGASDGLLYSDPSPQSAPHDFTTVTTLQVADRTWELTAAPAVSYTSVWLAARPWLFLTLGLAITLLLAIHFLTAQRRTAQAEALSRSSARDLVTANAQARARGGRPHVGRGDGDRR
jgi:CHASE1-domain containing sensor protein